MLFRSANYKAKFDALISAHYTAAIILHDRTLTLAQFEPNRYDDPRLRRDAAELVSVKPDTALTGVQSAIEIELKDGSKLSSRCEHPRGSYENPLTRAQIENKFRVYAKGIVPDANTESVIAAVNHLEDLPSVRTLMDLLRKTAQPMRGGRAA